MDLILWRHAEADPYDGDTEDDVYDLSRGLTKKGERQAQRMADWLEQRLAGSARVLASPAARCQQTAARLGRKFKTIDDLGPRQTPAAAIAASRWPTSNEAVVLVGHQPTLGLVAALLLTGQPYPFTVKKGAVWWLHQRRRDEKPQTLLQTVQAP